ncbi:acetyl-CoA C-acyltransferase, partial [Staphylococcus haemolyticus]
SMGDHCEKMAREWQISREAQDLLALGSHHKLAAAYDANFFEDLLVPFRGLKRDGFLRPDSTLEKLASLKPAFDKRSGKGTLTAGNATGWADGAAAVLLGSDEGAAKRGLKVQAYFRDAEVAAVDFVHGEGLLM